MKKTFLLFLVLILSAAAAFSSGWIGVDTGANIMWTNMKMDMGEESLSVSGSEIDYYLGLTGAHYFTDSVGLGYSVSMLYPLSAKVEDGDFQKVEDPDIQFKPALSFQYRHELGESMKLEAGIGLYYGYTSTKESGMKISMLQIGAEGNVGISFEPAEHLALKAGAKVLVPIFTNASATMYGITLEYDVNCYGIGVIPYLGIAYIY